MRATISKLDAAPPRQEIVGLCDARAAAGRNSRQRCQPSRAALAGRRGHLIARAPVAQRRAARKPDPARNGLRRDLRRARGCAADVRIRSGARAARER
jgi:hypothetical protein